MTPLSTLRQPRLPLDNLVYSTSNHPTSMHAYRGLNFVVIAVRVDHDHHLGRAAL